MNINRRAVLLAAVGLVSSPSFAQSYPDRPVKIIVPYAPGGTTDIFARVIASKLALLLGQPFIVDNRAGTGGAIGTALAAKAPPDGYTLVMLVESSHAVNPSVSLKLGYDPIADFWASPGFPDALPSPLSAAAPRIEPG